MDINEIIKKVTSGDIPTGALGGVGIIALLLAVKTARSSIKFLFVLAGLALVAGAVWWHLNHRS